jgi:hypothetical protein
MHLRRAFIVLTVLAALPLAATAQQKTAPPRSATATTTAASAVKPKIRTVTAFINLDPAQYEQQVAETLQMLRRAKTTFELRGYEL